MAKQSKSTKDKNPELDSEVLRLKTAEANLKEEDVKYRKKESELKELEVIQKSINIDDLRLSDKLSRIRTLSTVLMCFKIDDSATTIGSETKLKNLFDENEEQVIKDKILSIVKKL